MHFNISECKPIRIIQTQNDVFVARAGDGIAFPNDFAKHLRVAMDRGRHILP